MGGAPVCICAHASSIACDLSSTLSVHATRNRKKIHSCVNVFAFFFILKGIGKKNHICMTVEKSCGFAAGRVFLFSFLHFVICRNNQRKVP